VRLRESVGPRNSTFQGSLSLTIRLGRVESPSTRTRMAAMVEDKGLICSAEPDSDHVVTHVEKGLYLKARHVVARLAISVRHGVRPGLGLRFDTSVHALDEPG
jgi:hypothetical protein